MVSPKKAEEPKAEASPVPAAPVSASPPNKKASPKKTATAKPKKASTKPKKVVASAVHTKSSNSAEGPSYYDLIVEAIQHLKERTGSSRQAIAKYVTEKKKNYANHFLNKALRSAVEANKLVQVKGSYRVAAAAKKAAASKAKKTAAVKVAKKPVVKKAKVTKKKAPAKKAAVKKKAPKKASSKAAEKVIKKAAKPAKKK